jgi:hypothetical protein
MRQEGVPQVPDQPGLHSKTLSQKKKKKVNAFRFVVEKYCKFQLQRVSWRDPLLPPRSGRYEPLSCTASLGRIFLLLLKWRPVMASFEGIWDRTEFAEIHKADVY